MQIDTYVKKLEPSLAPRHRKDAIPRPDFEFQTIAIPDEEYLKSMEAFDKFRYFLTLATTPRLISALKHDYIVERIRGLSIDTMSGEYILDMAGKRRLVFSHRARPDTYNIHPFNYASRLEKGWTQKDEHHFIPITSEEARSLWMSVRSIEDVRHGRDSSNEIIEINLAEDDPQIDVEEELDYSQWMRNDVILAQCGSEENRIFLGEYLFKKEKRKTVKNNSACMLQKKFNGPVGRLSGLGAGNSGLSFNRSDSGRFLGVSFQTLDDFCENTNLWKGVYNQYDVWSACGV